jgi:hypothetical protein
MNAHTQWIRDEAGCSVEEALELQEIINSQWLIERWSEATSRQIRLAVKTAQAIKAS